MGCRTFMIYQIILLYKKMSNVATDRIKQEESNNESDGIYLEPEKDNPDDVMMANCYIPLASDAMYATVDMEKKRNCRK